MASDRESEADASLRFTSSSSSLSQQDGDRELLRQLMRRYGRDGLTQLMEEETTTNFTANDGASIISSSTLSSVKSEDAASIFDAASIRTMSDTSSVRGSILSNVSARTAKFLGRKSSSSLSSSTKRSTQPEEIRTSASSSAEPVSASIAAAKQKGAFTCGFCREEDIQKTCTRKNDLKRHMEDFHNMNAQWSCRHRGCRMVFDWQTAYKTHLKQAHSGTRMSLDEAKINLCPQTIFACGFENCQQVFEAPDDGETDATFKDFVGHVVKHFDEGVNCGEWTYSARMRNLLRQSGAAGAWASSSWPEAERNRLVWHPQSSGILRKRLETRHLGDLQMLVQYAIALGSEPSTIKQYREDFIIPVKDECRELVPGHKSRFQISSATAVSEPDPYQFRISRPADPSIAAYLASQRRVYVQRPGPVRSGRSARPPRHMLQNNPPPSNPIPHQYRYSNDAAPAMFDMRQQPPPQHYAMISQAGGIIAEDLQSLRSLAGSGSEADMEMPDSQMVDVGYVQDPGFSGPYGAGGIPSPAPRRSVSNNDGGHGPEHVFAPYDSTHAY